MKSAVLTALRARLAILGLFFWVGGAATGRAGDDFGSWHALSARFLDNHRWTLTGVTQVRIRDDNSQLYAYYFSPQAAFKASPYLRLGLNHTWLPAKPAGGRDFLLQRRWEIEATPRWPVKDWLTFELRNRLEIRRIEGRPDINERSRHRPRATFRVKGLGPLESVFMDNEVFHDYDAHRITENRLVPLGLNFRANPQTAFAVNYLLRSVRSGGDWTHSHILGTQLALSF
ncbi:MAG: DUF2490 domain-containing protein [Opitutaceae bacterium]|nr:DUF2490 domain-containing protein [Opitutaceae bacterium]